MTGLVIGVDLQSVARYVRFGSGGTVAGPATLPDNRDSGMVFRD